MDFSQNECSHIGVKHTCKYKYTFEIYKNFFLIAETVKILCILCTFLKIPSFHSHKSHGCPHLSLSPHRRSLQMAVVRWSC